MLIKKNNLCNLTYLIATTLIISAFNFRTAIASCGGPPPIPKIDTISPGVYLSGNKKDSLFVDSVVAKVKSLFTDFNNVALVKASGSHCIIDTTVQFLRPMKCTIEVEIIEPYQGLYSKGKTEIISINDVQDGNEGFYTWIVDKQFLYYTDFNKNGIQPPNIRPGCYSHNFGFYVVNGIVSSPASMAGVGIRLKPVLEELSIIGISLKKKKNIPSKLQSSQKRYNLLGKIILGKRYPGVSYFGKKGKFDY